MESRLLYDGMDYIGINVRTYVHKDCLISFHRGVWLCSCCLKYNRNASIECYHIRDIKKFEKLMSFKNERKMTKENREETIAEVLKFIAQEKTINGMRHQVLSLADKLESKKYYLVKIK